MKFANSVTIRVFVKDGEDYDAVHAAFRSLVPLDLEKEKVLVRQQAAVGFNERRIGILEIVLVKDRHIRAFLDFLRERLGERQRQLLIHQKESRLDSGLDFFVRLDKDKLLAGEFFVTDSGNCFHVKIGIAAFPRKRGIALIAVERLLS
ncbi:hypothetical protein HYY74_07585 [Candidatus Woesearchaeota archaeon]|nr:hypothetical protein [Candidatus Woesearchaeota archaeon]